MARIRYKADFKGTGELMRGPEMQAAMRQIAEEGADIARAIAPERTGEYKASIRVETLSRGGPHEDRAEGRIVADSDHAADVEWRDGHHTLARAVDALGDS
jgi:hypothetical protein